MKNYFSKVVALELMTVNGECHKCSATKNAELFSMALCSVGALGVIMTATVQVRKRKRRITDNIKLIRSVF